MRIALSKNATGLQQSAPGYRSGLAAVFVHLGGWFKVAVLSGSFLLLTVVLFVFSVRETRQFRRLANEP